MTRAPLFLLALAAWIAPLNAQTVVFGVGGEMSAPQYSYIEVPVFVDMRGAPGEKLGSYQVRVEWDETVLQLDSWEAGSFGQPVAREDSTSLGVLSLAGVSVPGQDGVFDLVRLRFYVSGAVTSAVTLQVQDAAAATSFTDLLGFTTTVSGSFCTAVGRWGDLDNDSLANSRDALAVLSNVVGLPADPSFNLALGDVDGNGSANTLDALIILSYAVGLPIPGHRVLLAAPGACGTGGSPTLAILPDTADVVVGQKVRLKLQARAADGRLLTLAANWESGDPNIAVVSGEGVLQGRAPGVSTVVAALGPGIRFTTPVVVRARRGTWHVNAQVAKRASVQLGTLQWPFSTPQRAFPLVQEGDTIRVAPGIVDYEDPYAEGVPVEEMSNDVGVGVVLIGDTLADGTRPVLRSPLDYYYYDAAISWRYSGGGEAPAGTRAPAVTTGRRAEIRDLVIRGFYYGVDFGGLASLTLDNVRIEHTANTYGYALYGGAIDTLRVLRSELVGSTQTSDDGLYLYDRAGLVQIQDSRIESWGSQGAYLEDVDSLEVLRSEFLNIGSSGIYVYTSGNRATGVWITNSTFDSLASGVDVNADSIVVTDNIFTRITTRGVLAEPSYSNAPFKTVAILRNQITCSQQSSPSGIETQYAPARIEDNGIRDCYWGIYAYHGGTYPLADLKVLRDTVLPKGVASSSTAIYVNGRWRATVSGNLTRRGYYGINLTLSDTAPARVDSNSVFGAGQYGLYLSASQADVTGLRNNFQSSPVGIYNLSSTKTRSFTDGIISGHTSWGIQTVAGGPAFGAMRNWWGDPGGPGSGGANAYTGNVDPSSFLTSAPPDVPPAPPPAPAVYPVAAGAAGLASGVADLPADGDFGAVEAATRHRQHRAAQAAWRAEREQERHRVERARDNHERRPPN